MEAGEQLGNSLVVYGMDQAGGNLLKGIENKAPLAHKDVWDGEARRLQDVTVVEKDVKVNGSRPPGERLFLCQFFLYSFQEGKQIKGCK